MTDCLGLGSLSGSSLKVIAIVSMTIDHLGLYMLGGEDAASGSVTYHLMRMVGRLAFPIFAFLLVEGYVHTRDIRKYMMNLFVAAVISDIPWMLLGGFDSHNVMFTLLMGLMAMSLIDRFWQKRFLTLSVIAVIGALAEWLHTDYSWRGIFLICVLFMFREKHYERANAVDCFDNDLPGRVYSLRMASVLGDRHLNIVRTDDFVMVTAGGKELKMSHEGTSLAELSRHFRVPKRLSQWKPPMAFKDWNDVIMNKPYVQKEEVNKFQRNKALEQRRTKGLKL